MESGAAKPQTKGRQSLPAGPSRLASHDTARPAQRAGQPQIIIILLAEEVGKFHFPPQSVGDIAPQAKDSNHIVVFDFG